MTTQTAHTTPLAATRRMALAAYDETGVKLQPATEAMIAALDEAAFGDVWVTLLDRDGAREINAPLVTTRRMALATLCDDIEQAEGLTAANQVVLNVLAREGRAEPHHYARLAFDNAAIDIMWHQHAALLGRSMDDRV